MYTAVSNALSFPAGMLYEIPGRYLHSVFVDWIERYFLVVNLNGPKNRQIYRWILHVVLAMYSFSNIHHAFLANTD